MKELPLTKHARDNTQSVARLGVLLSLALILQLVEGMLPTLGLPGVKLGLANTVALLVLELWGFKPAFFLVILRQVVGGILTGKLLSVGFYFGLTGGLAGMIVMHGWQRCFGNRRDLVTTSIAGAIAHNWGQLAAARFLLSHEAVLWYLPLLTVAAVPCGMLVACLCRPLMELFSQKQMSLFRADGKQVFVLVGIVVLGLGFPLSGLGAGSPAVAAKIQVADQIVQELSLDKEGMWVVQGKGHIYTVQIKEGQIRILAADCPDQICVRTGFISRHRQSILCAPGQLIIKLDAPSGNDIDGILP